MDFGVFLGGRRMGKDRWKIDLSWQDGWIVGIGFCRQDRIGRYSVFATLHARGNFQHVEIRGEGMEG